MGLDQYLGRYHKANLEKTMFNAEETERLKGWWNGYNVFKNTCPKPFENIATKVTATNQYYDMDKISDDFGNGNRLSIGGFFSGKIFFSNYDKGIRLELDADMIHKDYVYPKKETAYVVEGEFEVAYWRKANQIRQWFVNHIEEFNEDDNCEYYTVTRELLEDLIRDCQTVLACRDNYDVAEDILPTSSGFFFGSTDYDDWYYEQLESTIEQCERVIKETDWITEVVVYTESW